MPEEFLLSSPALTSRRIGDAMSRLANLPEGQRILSSLSQNNVNVELDTTYPGSATCLATIAEVRSGRYAYKSLSQKFGDLPDGNLVQAMIHETEHIDQHAAGILIPPALLNEEDHMLWQRILEADAQAEATHVSFLMHLRGDKTPFIAVHGVGYTDMAQAYENAYARDQGAICNGTAKRAAFDAWFSNDFRVAAYDRDTQKHLIPYINDLLQKNPDHGLPSGTLKKEWVQTMGCLAGCANYLNHGPDVLTDPYYRQNLPKQAPDSPILG